MKKRIKCSNCASVAHVDGFCPYPKLSARYDAKDPKIATRILSDRQKEALYRHFFTMDGDGIDLRPGSPKREELTDYDFQQMAESLNGASLLASLALRDYFDEMGQELRELVKGERI